MNRTSGNILAAVGAAIAKGTLPSTAPDLPSLYDEWEAACEAHERAIAYTDEALGDASFPDRDRVLDARFEAQSVTAERHNAAEDAISLALALPLVAAVAARRQPTAANNKRMSLLLCDLFEHAEKWLDRIGAAP
jgi:hypothetical protein